jgi:putative flippase GtrA
MSVKALVLRLARSGGAGIVATLADLALLRGLAALGVAPRVASVPALTLGTLVMFFAQKYFVFESKGRPARREILLFTLVQAGGYALTLFLYDSALRLSPWFESHYLVARLVVTNVVWLGYSFPLWHWVFRPRAVDKSPIRP